MDRANVSFDWWLITPVVLLVCLGLFMLRSVAPQQLVSQTIFVAISVAVFLVFSLTDYRWFFSLHLPAYALSLLAMILPFLFGISSRGAHRWLIFGDVFFQPSEVAKPFLLITFAMLAAGLSQYKQAKLAVAFLIPALIIFFQPDLGTMLVLTVGWLTVFVPQLPRKAVLVGALVLIILSPLTWFLLRDYQRDRLLTFINPHSDPLGKGYQVIQSTIAVGSGQWWGKGLGQGTQSQLQFLPEQHTDFMFATLAEELGFVGAGAVIILFGLVFNRIYALAFQAPDLAANFFCLGVLASLGFQVFINIGMNMGLAPVTGITLPFVSYGGSSLLSLAITFGILAAISRQGAGKIA
ncbi:MAG: FtsW/RodA/SpoVE family cell cycle protein [bacterium]|nr:FtsW/RodA/SpoVE family cell cycle protein [bacterium]